MQQIRQLTRKRHVALNVNNENEQKVQWPSGKSQGSHLGPPMLMTFFICMTKNQASSKNAVYSIRYLLLFIKIEHLHTIWSMDISLLRSNNHNLLLRLCRFINPLLSNIAGILELATAPSKCLQATLSVI